MLIQHSKSRNLLASDIGSAISTRSIYLSHTPQSSNLSNDKFYYLSIICSPSLFKHLLSQFSIKRIDPDAMARHHSILVTAIILLACGMLQHQRVHCQNLGSQLWPLTHVGYITKLAWGTTGGFWDRIIQATYITHLNLDIHTLATGKTTFPLIHRATINL